MIRRSLVVIATSLFFIACSNQNSGEFTPIETEAIAIDIVTGLNLVNATGERIGLAGNPNILNTIKNEGQNTNDKKSIGDDVITSYNPSDISVYPTITNDIISIKSIRTIQSIWLLKGTPVKKFHDVNYDNLLSNSLYTPEDIASKAIYNVTETFKNLTINLRDFEQGYYRLFIEVESGEIIWENIAIGYQNDDFDFWN